MPNRSLGHFDLIVMGAGSAGASAAIAAARSGSNVLVIDRLPFVGGTSTAVLDTFYGFYTPGEQAKKIVGGIPDDVIDGLKSFGSMVERPNTYGAGTGVTYNPEHLKVVWESLLVKSGAKILLHALLQQVNVKDGKVSELILATRAGLCSVTGDFFIDATGDADLSNFAGFGYEKAGEISPAQTLTTTFKMVNVDLAERKKIKKEQLHELMQDAADNGYELPRREGSDHITPVANTTATVMTRLDSVRKNSNGEIESVLDDPFFLTDSEIAGRRQASEYARFLVDKVPGYKDSSLYGFSTLIGVRETRRVYGDYRVTKSDVLEAKQFDDQVALCGAPIEDHHSGDGTNWIYLPDGSAVGIPLRSLIVKDSINTMVIGRCFSASHDAHASIRSMAQCMAMGVAAGVAGSIALANKKEIRKVTFSDIRTKIIETGAILEVPSK
ncbi:MAG: FAD-dependent oxidoreductase [Actinomycetes bacterium]|jgi:FAD dependent oxidoreductase